MGTGEGKQAGDNRTESELLRVHRTQKLRRALGVAIGRIEIDRGRCARIFFRNVSPIWRLSAVDCAGTREQKPLCCVGSGEFQNMFGRLQIQIECTWSVPLLSSGMNHEWKLAVGIRERTRIAH